MNSNMHDLSVLELQALSEAKEKFRGITRVFDAEIIELLDRYSVKLFIDFAACNSERFAIEMNFDYEGVPFKSVNFVNRQDGTHGLQRLFTVSMLELTREAIRELMVRIEASRENVLKEG